MTGARKLGREDELETYIEWIRNTNLLRSLSDHHEALEYFASLLEKRFYDAGELVCSEGKHDDRVYFLIKGAVDVYKTTPDGDPFKVATVDDSMYPYLGEGALLHSEVRNSTIKTETDCTFLCMTRSNFERFCSEKPEWAFPIMKHIAVVLSNRLRKVSRDFVLTYQALVEEIRKAK